MLFRSSAVEVTRGSGGVEGQAASRGPLVRGVDFAPDTQDPGAVLDLEDDVIGAPGSEFVPDSEDDCLLQYDSDEVQFVPDSLIGTEEFIPDSFPGDGFDAEDVDGIDADEVVIAPAVEVVEAQDPVRAQDVENAEEHVGAQLDENEVCYSMLRILLPAYFRIPGNENLGL